MLVFNNDLPTSSVFGLFDPPISLLLIAGAFTLGGYLGVLYYRYTNNKRPLFIIQFWGKSLLNTNINAKITNTANAPKVRNEVFSQ